MDFKGVKNFLKTFLGVRNFLTNVMGQSEKEILKKWEKTRK